MLRADLVSSCAKAHVLNTFYRGGCAPRGNSYVIRSRALNFPRDFPSRRIYLEIPAESKRRSHNSPSLSSLTSSFPLRHKSRIERRAGVTAIALAISLWLFRVRGGGGGNEGNSLFYVSFVTVNRRDGITPRFVRHRYVRAHVHAAARPSSLCLINSLREVRGCATGMARDTPADRSVPMRRREEEAEVEMFDAHGVPARSDVLIQRCLDALIK